MERDALAKCNRATAKPQHLIFSFLFGHKLQYLMRRIDPLFFLFLTQRKFTATHANVWFAWVSIPGLVLNLFLIGNFPTVSEFSPEFTS